MSSSKPSARQPTSTSLPSRILLSSVLVFASSIVLRVVLLLYGSYQDAHSPLKYTDIDYYVFTDAARYVSHSRSPYDRATYRYTPLLAWLLYPTSWGGLWFHYGKALFAISDVVAGWLMLKIMAKQGIEEKKALKYVALVWLWNPMIANISTRGSSEGLLCVMVMGLLWAFDRRSISLTGCFLGLAVHFKIYPFIYGIPMFLELSTNAPLPANVSIAEKISSFFNRSRLTLVFTSIATFATLNIVMYNIYGVPFLQHTYFHHLTRLDHRHNFSPYNTLLYLSSATTATVPSSSTASPSFNWASLAFLPQLTLTLILIPSLTLRTSSKRNPIRQSSSTSPSSSQLPFILLAQTLAFTTFNKVATSQYFLWYLVFLPLYLPASSFIKSPRFGLVMLASWIAGQALWLYEGWLLEFLGQSTFIPGLWTGGSVFFTINCLILGFVIGDIT